MGSVTAVVAAAGSGQRLGAGGPKAFVPVAGRPLVEWSLAALHAAPSVTAIVVARPPDREPAARGCDSTRIAGISATSSGKGAVWGGVRTVDGGAERADSVANALAVVETELVAIHDAARPLLTPELLEETIATLTADPDASGAVAATPVTDTIKQAAGGGFAGRLVTLPTDTGAKGPVEIESTLDRGRLWAAQTPQVFRVDALRAALAANPERVATATDEAVLVEVAGGKVLIHPAPAENLKVTTPLDLRLAELLLAERSGRDSL